MASNIINSEKIKIIEAEKENEHHRREVWNVFNENIEFFYLTNNPVPYEDHCKWWDNAFNQEYIYLISIDFKIIGYIRLTKGKTNNKDKNEISIAISKKFQNQGIGMYAYKKFEKEMKLLSVNEIIAKTSFKNELGREFFEKNNFKKSQMRYTKKI